jgi:AraC-like DNA-binding protein
LGVLLGLEHNLKAPVDMVMQLMKRSPNLAAANVISHQYRSLSSEVTFWRLETQDKLATVYRYNDTPFQFDHRQHRLFNMTRSLMAGRTLLQDQWQPHSLNLAFAKPGTADYQQLLGLPVYFNQETDCYRFPVDDLYKPLPSHDHDLLRILQSHADELKHKFQIGQSIISVVRKLMLQSVASQRAKLDIIAALLQMHPRALQRQLLSEGMSFKPLLSKTRMDSAQDLLGHTQIPLTQIADILGYSELSAFSRAFKVSTGQSPEQWRKHRKL